MGTGELPMRSGGARRDAAGPPPGRHGLPFPALAYVAVQASTARRTATATQTVSRDRDERTGRPAHPSGYTRTHGEPPGTATPGSWPCDHHLAT